MQKAKHNGQSYHSKTAAHLLKNKIASKRIRYFMPLLLSKYAMKQKQLLPYEIAVGVGVGIIASALIWYKYKK